MRQGGEEIARGNAEIAETARSVDAITRETLEAVAQSVDTVRGSSESTRNLVEWVRSLEGRIAALETTLKNVKQSNDEIVTIASQVNILAINASIEAARAGPQGRGFAIVAGAVNELSQRTQSAASGVAKNVDGLSKWVLELRDSSASAADSARIVSEGADSVEGALGAISNGVGRIGDRAQAIGSVVAEISERGEHFSQTVSRIGEVSVAGVQKARMRVSALIDRSETIVQDVASLGGATDDSRFVAYVRDAAARVGAEFENAIANGRITRDALFNQRYREIPGTDPVQHLAPYTALTDKLLPAIQEKALAFHANVVFCAAIDRNGYIPTHNRKFSKPQGSDPVWNAANSRNRRIFDDRVGLKAGRNNRPFLLQVYRRDMGGGNFVLMKDCSAPIMVQGRHWGGLRLAYKF